MNKNIFEKYKDSKSDLLNEQLMLSMTVPVVEIVKIMFVASIAFFLAIGIYEMYNSNFNFGYFKSLSLSLLFAIATYSLLLVCCNKVMFRYLLPKIYYSMKIRDRLFEKGIEQYFDLSNSDTKNVIKNMQYDIQQQEISIGGYNGSLLIEIHENILKEKYQSRNNVVQIV